MTTKRKDNKRRVLKEGEYQRANGTFEFRWRDKAGRRHSIYGKTLDELRQKEEEALRDRLDGITPPKKSMAINDLFAIWLGQKRGLKDNSIQNYERLYNNHIRDGFGKTRLVNLRPLDVKQFYLSLVEEKGLKVSSVEILHALLHQVLNVGVDNDFIRRNYSDRALRDLKAVYAEESEKRKPLTREEQQILEDFLQKPGPYHKWQPIFTFMLYTGMRAGEVAGLQWSDIDFKQNVIHVDRTLIYCKNGEGKNEYRTNSPKSKAGRRTIQMLPQAKDALLAERQRQEDFGIRCNVTISGYSDFVFLSDTGSVVHLATMNHALKQIVKACNAAIQRGAKEDNHTLLPEISSHIFRHTFATRMSEAGINPKVMQTILGHGSINMTMDVYTDATEDFKAAQLIDLSDYLKQHRPA